MTLVLKKTKNSPLRDSSDYAKLSNALTELGELDRAINTLNEAKETFTDAHEVKLLSSIEAVTQQKAGNHALAQKALEKALELNVNFTSEASSLALAKACLAHERTDQAMSILKTLVQNNPDSVLVQTNIATVLKDYGGAEISQKLIENSVKEVISLNNEAVKKAKEGLYAEAAEMLREAAIRLPNNLQIVSNASLSLLADIFMNGMNREKAALAQFQQAVIDQNAQHPKLPEIANFLIKIERKYKLTEPL